MRSQRACALTSRRQLTLASETKSKLSERRRNWRRPRRAGRLPRRRSRKRARPPGGKATRSTRGAAKPASARTLKPGRGSTAKAVTSGTPRRNARAKPAARRSRIAREPRVTQSRTARTTRSRPQPRRRKENGPSQPGGAVCMGCHASADAAHRIQQWCASSTTCWSRLA